MQTSLLSFTAPKNIDDEIRTCQKCPLWKTRTNAVPGEGGFRKKVMFVGEAPGKWEDIKGRPFVGAAGKYLDELLSSIGLSREDVYITNIVKCRPPNNRDPTDEEIHACAPYLEWQIEHMRPRVICPLGRFSAKFILEKFGFSMKSITAAQGKIYRGEIIIIPMFHPAAALYHGKWKPELEKAFATLKSVLEDMEN